MSLPQGKKRALETEMADIPARKQPICMHPHSRVKLSASMTCSKTLRSLLNRDTIEVCNRIIPTLSEDDPCLVVQLPDASAIHQALLLPSCPADLVVGVDENQSMANFRHWLVQRAHQVVGVADKLVEAPLTTCCIICPANRPIIYHTSNCIFFNGHLLFRQLAYLQLRCTFMWIELGDKTSYRLKCLHVNTTKPFSRLFGQHKHMPAPLSNPFHLNNDGDCRYANCLDSSCPLQYLPSLV